MQLMTGICGTAKAVASKALQFEGRRLHQAGMKRCRYRQRQGTLGTLAFQRDTGLIDGSPGAGDHRLGLGR